MSIELRRDTMTALLKEREELHEQLAQVDAVISGLQKICRHKKADGTSALVFKGNDSHRHYYECEICREQIQE
jgi:ABC-type transporter Mla MlaB component